MKRFNRFFVGCIAGILITGILAEIAYCQRAYITYGDSQDNIYGSYLNSDGTIALCGQRGARDNPHIWLMEVELNGRVVLDVVLDDIESATGMDLIEVDGGGYLIGGYTNQGPFSNYGFFAVRTDADGEVIWANEYPDPENWGEHNRCFDVIELKNGDFALAGQAHHHVREDHDAFQKGLIMRITPDGDVVWNRVYHGNEGRHQVRGQAEVLTILESGGNILGGGSIRGEGGWLFAVDQADGDMVWEHITELKPVHAGDEHSGMWGTFSKIVSLQGSYYAFGHGYTDLNEGDPDLVAYPLYKINGDGDILDRFDLDLYPIGREVNSFIFHIRAARPTRDGSIVYTCYRSTDGQFENYEGMKFALIGKIDAEGHKIWEDTLEYIHDVNSMQVADNHVYVFGHQDYRMDPYKPFYHKLIDSPIPFIVRAGHNDEEDFDLNDPEGENHNERGNGFNLTVLQGDTVRFWVEGEDRNNRDLNFEWTFDGEVIGNLDSEVITFDEVGRFEVMCRLMNENDETLDSLVWHVNVVELYIISRTPSEDFVRPMRGDSVRFEIDIRAILGRQLFYEWMINDRPISNERSFWLQPLQDFDPHRISVTVSNGNASDSTSWTAQLSSVFVTWIPESNVVSTPPFSTVLFEVVLDEGLPEELECRWILGEDTLADVGKSIVIVFGQEAHTFVKVEAVLAGGILEELVWTVNVMPLGVGVGRTAVRPIEIGFLGVTPNPFNSTVTIRYSSPINREATRLSIHDISGREVARLVDAQAVSPLRLTAGDSGVNHRGLTPYEAVSLNASALPAGIYFARLESGGEVSTVKMVLVR